jgi:hypothetical protein
VKMTNLEKYNKIIKMDLEVKDEDLNDDALVYNRHENWDSITHMELVADLEEAFDVQFDMLDTTSFGKYSMGIEILKKLGVDI